MKTYNVGLSDLTKRVLPIGYEGENLYTQVRVNCEEIFRDYPSATAGIAIQGPDGEVYPAAVTKTGNDIVWTITSSFLSAEGTGLGQLTFVDNETVIKSEIFHFVVYNSLVADGEMPDPVEDWITEANNKLGEVEAAVEQIPQTIDDALAEAKASGEFDGEDGFSPVISVTEITDGHRVSITDAEGTESFDVMNGDPGQPGQPGAPGQPGQDGVSPTVSVTPITDGHEVTITDATGAHSFDVMNGEKGDPGTPGDPTKLIDDTSTTATDKVWSAKKSADDVSDLKSAIDALEDDVDAKYTKPASGIPASDLASGVIPSVPVQDVTLNGVTALANGVAKLEAGFTKDSNNNIKIYTMSEYGTGLSGGGENTPKALQVVKAQSSDIKNGTNNFKPIVSSTQHESTFYGLAKAAGADMSSVSGATVGVYPEAQKSAISQMLDAPETVSGTTPSITAKPGVRYVCGECSTLSFTPPASGCCDVLFESGSTPTVLTVPNTVKFPAWFDPSSLEASVTYEINILDGVYGTVASWA